MCTGEHRCESCTCDVRANNRQLDTDYFNQHSLISSIYVYFLKLNEWCLPEFLASMSISGAGLGKLRPREEERVVEKGAASSSSSS